MAVNPVALGRHLGRAQHRVVLEQAAQKHRLVGHPVAQALQSQRQLLERQVGVGRDEVQVKGDVVHGRP